MAAISTAGNIVEKAWARAWARPDRIDCPTFAERFRVVGSRSSGMPGLWSHARTPYGVEIMRAFSDPRVRRITVKKAEQLGGTEIMVLNPLLWLCVHDPGPVLIVYPNEHVGQKQNQERLIPAIQACEPVRKFITPRAYDLTASELRLVHMTIRFASGEKRAKAGREGFPYKFLFIDELDRCAPEIMTDVYGRTNTYPDHKIVDGGTPESDEDLTAQEYQKGSRREFVMPCPHCQAWNVRRYEDVRWTFDHTRVGVGGVGGGMMGEPAERVRHAAYFRCPHCQSPIHGAQAIAQLRLGTWVTEEEWTEGGGAGKWTPDLPRQPLQAHESFNLRGELNPFQPNVAGYLASELVGAKGIKTRHFVNKRLGREWVPPEKIETLTPLKSLRLMVVENKVHGADKDERRNWGRGYMLGELPWPDEHGREPVVLSCAADVQKTYFRVEVIGWGPRRETAWLIDAGRVERRGMTLAEGMFDELEEYLLRSFALVDRVSGEERRRLPIALSVIDAGHWTDQVYAFTRGKLRAGWGMVGEVGGVGVDEGDQVEARSAGGLVCAARGWYEEGVPRSVAGPAAAGVPWFSRPEKQRDGKMAPWSVHVMNFVSALEKARLWEVINADVEMVKRVRGRGLGGGKDEGGEEVGGERIESAGVDDAGAMRRLYFPEDTPSWYFDELNAEAETTKVVSGRPKKGWMLRAAGRANHALDCRLMNNAAARAWRLAEARVKGADGRGAVGGGGGGGGGEQIGGAREEVVRNEAINGGAVGNRPGDPGIGGGGGGVGGGGAEAIARRVAASPGRRWV